LLETSRPVVQPVPLTGETLSLFGGNQ
jgi:hypothetical protein